MVKKPLLRIPLAEADKSVAHCINTSRDFSYAPSEGPQLERAIKRFDKWISNVKETLEELFTTPEMAERFMTIGL